MEQPAETSRFDADRALNFATSPDTDGFTMPHKRPRTARDPMSHRIIEKRRRDRMNNCLADLSHLIPASYLKQGQGRIEKTEIIEMAIQHIKHLHMLHLNRTKEGDTGADKFYLGFRECMDEMMRFLVEKQGFSASEPVCVQIVKHLQEHSQQFLPPGGIGASTKSKPETTSRPNENNSDNTNGDVKEPVCPEMQPRLMPMGDDKQAGHDTVLAQDSVYNHINQDSIAFGHTNKEGSSQSGSQSFLADNMEDDNVSLADSGTGASITSDWVRLSMDGLRQNLTEQQQRDQHIYKFKNDIKSRFQSEDSVSDLISQSSSLPPCGASATPSINSDTGSSSGNGNSRPNTSQAGRGSTGSLAASHVPGFVLHTSGTYYIPVVIDSSSYMAVLQPEEQQGSGMGVLHPISIPVSFGGNFISALRRSHSRSGSS